MPPQQYADPVFGNIADNLGQAIFGNPDNYARNSYYKAESDRANAQTGLVRQQQQAQQDSLGAQQTLSDFLANPDHYRPPAGVDPDTWFSQTVAPVMSAAVKVGYRDNPEQTAKAMSSLASTFSILRGTQAGGITGMALQGKPSTAADAFTPQAQADIAARDQANVMQKDTADNSNKTLNTKLEIGGRAATDAADNTTKSANNAADNARAISIENNKPIVAGPDQTVLVSPLAAQFGNTNNGVLNGKRSDGGVKADALVAAGPQAALAASFNPHNTPPGDQTTYAAGDPRAAASAVVVNQPKPGAMKIPALHAKDQQAIDDGVGAVLDPDGVDGKGHYPIGNLLSVLPPEVQQGYRDAVGKAYQDSNANSEAAIGAGASYLKSKVNVNTGIGSMFSDKFTPVAPASTAAQPVPARSQAAPAAASPPAGVPAPQARVPGQAYPTPAGNAVWTGTGWVSPAQWLAFQKQRQG